MASPDSTDESEIDVDNYNPPPEEEAVTKNNEIRMNDDVDEEEPDPPVVVVEEEPAQDKDKLEDVDMDNVMDTSKTNNGMEMDSGEVQHEPTFFADSKGNLKFVNMVVKCPCTIFWLLLLTLFVISALLMYIVSQGGNPFTIDGIDRDLSDVRSIQYDSLRLANEEVTDARDIFLAGTSEAIPKQSEDADFTYWVFEGENFPEGVFGTAEAIEAMKDAFDIFQDDAGFQNYCKLIYQDARFESTSNSNSTNGTATTSTATEPYCEPPRSPLTLYYASQWDSDKAEAILQHLKTPGNIETFNTLALCYTRGLFCDRLVGQDISQEDIAFAIDLNNNITSMSEYWDLKGDLNQNFTQVTELAAYLKLVDVYRFLVDFGYDKNFNVSNQFSMYSRGVLLWGGPLETSNLTPDQKEEQAEVDDDERKDYVVDNYLDDMNKQSKKNAHSSINSYYFMGSLLLDVLLEIVQQDGMLAIFSLVFVFLWLRINVGSWFLATVGILEIFFSIPVAWFFFSVVFRVKFFAFLNALSIFIVAAIGADDIFIFMDAYKQSAHRHPENLVSLETRMSWVYRRTGFAMAITSATTCAAFLCTLITPLVAIQSFGIFAAFVILIDYVLVMSLYCTAVVIYHNRFEKRSCMGCCCTDCSLTDPTPTAAAKEAVETGDDDHKEDFVSTFFRTRVSVFIQQPLNRAVLGVVFLTWLGIAIWQTSQIEAVKEAEQFLSDEHPFQKSLILINNEFPSADEDIALKIYYTWGLGEIDRSGVNLLLDPEFSGKPVFLESFNFNEQCQTAMAETCEALKSDPKYNGFVKRKEGVGQVYCFIEELAAFNVNGNLDDCNYVQKGDWKDEDWQISPDNLSSVMEDFLQQRSCREQTESISSFYTNELGWDGQSLRYAAISVENDLLNPFSQEPQSVTRAEYDQFVELAKELEQTVSQACGGGVIMTDLDGIFIFMNNQSIYVQTAVQASLLGVAIAFTVLFIATRVFHIAFFASLSICSVLVSVTGSMVLLGWDLGSIEAILIGIIAGFSVDYVVHLAHAYEIADGDTYERLTSAYGDMGISVMNGMITSVAASIPLFFCELQFFKKFGTFLCLTIAFSWIFANFAFMSVLAQLKIPIKKGGCRL